MALILKKNSWEIMSMLCDGEKSVCAVETRSVVMRREVSERENEERGLEEERVTVKLMNLTEVDKDEESVMGDGDITGGLWMLHQMLRKKVNILR